jgi:ABC-2 type transport system ATP-binding protein
MLSGLIKPTSGHFTINGLSPQKNGFKLRQIIGIVPQEYALYPTLTAKKI